VVVLLTARYNAEIPEFFPHMSSYVLFDTDNVFIYLHNIYWLFFILKAHVLCEV